MPGKKSIRSTNQPKSTPYNGGCDSDSSTMGNDYTSTTALCQGCDKLKAVQYCLDCEIVYCSECLSLHDGIPRYKTHRRGNPSTIPHCSTHKEKQLEYFCLSCLKVICADCVVFNGCSTHYTSIIKTTQMVDRVRDNLSRFDQEVSHLAKSEEYQERKDALTKTMGLAIHHLEQGFTSTLSASHSYSETALQKVLDSSFSPLKPLDKTELEGLLNEMYNQLHGLADLINERFVFVNSYVKSLNIKQENAGVPQVNVNPKFSVINSTGYVNSNHQATIKQLETQLNEVNVKNKELVEEREVLLRREETSLRLAESIVGVIGKGKDPGMSCDMCVNTEEEAVEKVVEVGGGLNRCLFNPSNKGSHLTLSQGNSVVTKHCGSNWNNSFVQVNYSGNCTVVFTRLDTTGNQNVMYGFFNPSYLQNNPTNDYSTFYQSNVYQNNSSVGGLTNASGQHQSVIVTIQGNTAYFKVGHYHQGLAINIPGGYVFGVLICQPNISVSVK
ncbi:hypothetical protein P9112_006034 [Eukaryota sp. TZLM1-RC]